MDFVTIEGTRAGYGSVELCCPDGLALPAGITVVLGPNGAGKTTLGAVLAKGRYAYGNRLRFASGVERVKMLAFTDIHSLGRREVQYMAQRMESSANDFVPTVAEVVGQGVVSAPRWRQLCDMFGLRGAEEKKVNFLSSGELRKVLIASALMDEPHVLVLDNPYIGLDAESRAELDKAMCSMRGQGMSVVMLLCDVTDVPGFADAVIHVDSRRVGVEAPEPAPVSPVELPPRIERRDEAFEVAFAIRNGHIRYGDKTVLEGVDWTVRRGERWVLTGRNGSGKSLLLSMVCADNPQGYANDIVLFDHPRGSGETIWQIKDSIGYVSPEMQLFFRSTEPVESIIARGLKPWLDRFAPLTDAELDAAARWMRIFEIDTLAGRRFGELSAGEQRVVLLARALVKQPPLLILDEPLHGLDSRRKEIARRVIDALVERNGSSLIFVTHHESEIPACVTMRKNLCR